MQSGRLAVDRQFVRSTLDSHPFLISAFFVMRAIALQLIHAVTWLPRVGLWISREGKDIWITLAVLAVALGAVYAFGVGEQSIRIAGFFLELLGLAVVAIGLNDSRQLFGRPGVYTAIKNSMKRFPKPWRGTHVLVVGSAGSVSGSATAAAIGNSTSRLPTTLEERVALLEEKLYLADTQINEGRRKLEEEAKKRKAAIEAEAEARDEGDRAVQKLIEEAVIGGIRLETMGVVWLAFGLTLSSLSEEIACLINKLVGT